MPAANPPPPPFPLTINDFSSMQSDFTLGGNAKISGTSLQLTDTGNNETAIAVYNQTIPSANDGSFEFNYTSSGGNGADGLVFFLVDGDKVTDPSQIQPGAFGGGLGYSSSGKGFDGITDGFLGVGLDTYGNYESINGGPGQMPNSVGLRGQGSGQNGYNLLASSVYAPGIDGDRTVRVNLTKISATQERVQVMVAPSGTTNFTTAVDTVINQPLPSKFYVGFAASTGGLNDNHIIRDFKATLLASLDLSAATIADQTTGQTNPQYLNPGDRFTETYTVTNSGSNDDGQASLTDALPLNAVGTSWQVTDSAGVHTGTGSAIPLNIAAGSKATITISGQIDPNASAGNANNVATLAEGAAYTNNSTSPTSETAVVKVGQMGGGSVSLVAANQVVMDSDTASVMPFNGSGGKPAAIVVDTYQDPSGAANTEALSVSVDPSQGSLAATGANYNPNTGILSATGTAAQVQSILQAVVYTPKAYVNQAGSTTPVALNVRVTSTVAGNTTGAGGTQPSASQVETVAVTATHDSPVISGAANGQSVNDNATTTPFGMVSVVDPDNVGAVAMVTVSGGTAQGDFTGASTQNWTRSVASNGDVVYTETFAAQRNIGTVVQAALRGLVFMPTQLNSTEANPNPVSILLSVTDTAANPASAAATATLNVQDVTPPAAPMNVALAATSDTGVQGDATTDQAQPTFMGTAEPGSTVTLYDGTMAVGSGTVSAAGAWSVTASALSDGAHQISAMDTDEAGLMSGLSAPASITVDTVMPAAQSVSTATSTGNNSIAASQTATFTVALSEAVIVNTAAGMPFLSLDDGGRAVYAGQPDARHLVFTYTAGAKDFTNDLTVTGYNANGATVTDAAGNAVAAPSFAAAQGAQSGVSVTNNQPIYRFFNTGTGSHFYTNSAQEVAMIHSTRPDLVQETSTFQGVNQNSTSAEAIYRFFDTRTGSHFLTSDQAEVKTVMQTRPDLAYEGVDFYAHATQQTGDTAVYRFFDTGNGSHLYTTAETERASLITNPAFINEGIGFWAPPNTHA